MEESRYAKRADRIMVIDGKLINYLEDLSFITLSAGERERICSDLEKILSGMELLSTIDVQGEQEQDIPVKFKTGLRKDEVKASFPCGEILKNAPETNGKAFIVPQIVE